MAVDRCICHNITFSRLKEETARTGACMQALANATGCTTNCGMCKPYIIQMLLTGQTVFPLISEPAARVIIAQWEQSQLQGHLARPSPGPAAEVTSAKASQPT